MSTKVKTAKASKTKTKAKVVAAPAKKPAVAKETKKTAKASPKETPKSAKSANKGDQDAAPSAPALPEGVDPDELEEAADAAAASSASSSSSAAAAAAAGGGEMSASFKNFRHHPDMENFYRFIFDNDLRHEALAIIDEMMAEKARKKAAKQSGKHT